MHENLYVAGPLSFSKHFLLHKIPLIENFRDEYLGMILDFTLEEKLQVDMRYYIDDMINDYPYPIKSANSL